MQLLQAQSVDPQLQPPQPEEAATIPSLIALDDLIEIIEITRVPVEPIYVQPALYGHSYYDAGIDDRMYIPWPYYIWNNGPKTVIIFP